MHAIIRASRSPLSNCLRHLNMTARMRFLDDGGRRWRSRWPRRRRARGQPARARRRRVDTAALIATELPRRARTSSTCRWAGWNGKLDVYLPRRPNGAAADGGAVSRRRVGHGQQGRDCARRTALPRDGVRGRQRRLPAWRGWRRRRPRSRTAAARCAGSCATRPSTASIRRGWCWSAARPGAHLALMAALAPPTAGFDGLCPGNEPLTGGGGDQLLRHRRRRGAARAAAPARLRGRVDGAPRPTRPRAPRACRRSTTSPRGRRRC